MCNHNKFDKKVMGFTLKLQRKLFPLRSNSSREAKLLRKYKKLILMYAYIVLVMINNSVLIYSYKMCHNGVPKLAKLLSGRIVNL